MVNLAICAKCPRCTKYYPLDTDDRGNVVRFPSADCGSPELPLIGNSDLPENCMYLLEQRVSEEDAWNEFESLKEQRRFKHECRL